MSTRCQLRFITQTGGDTPARVAQVYRHADGHPGSVLRTLAQLQQLLAATRTQRGPGYTAAAFIFLDKLATLELYLDDGPIGAIDASTPADLVAPASMEALDQPLFLLGHGVEDPADGIHGDEEYLYVVELPGQPLAEPADWTVRVSGDCAFPRHEGPTDQAFERATWQFEGSLETAVERFCEDAS
jgi:hypothetical protein